MGRSAHTWYGPDRPSGPCRRTPARLTLGLLLRHPGGDRPAHRRPEGRTGKRHHDRTRNPREEETRTWEEDPARAGARHRATGRLGGDGGRISSDRLEPGPAAGPL